MKTITNSCCVILATLVLAGCEGVFLGGSHIRPDLAEETAVQDENGLRPAPRPAGLVDAPKPAPSAHTAEQYDTTTNEQRAAAVSAAQTGPSGKILGKTIASLGDPAEPGIWMKTPLVSKRQQGRIEYAVTGKSVAIELIPLDGPKTAGSRVSLAALRLVEAPLTGLPELIVYGN